MIFNTKITQILLSSPGDGGGFLTFIPLILIILVFYFLFIRPNLKKKSVEETPIEKDATPEINDRNFCSNCGKEIKMNAKFCGYCGNNLFSTVDNYTKSVELKTERHDNFKEYDDQFTNKAKQYNSKNESDKYPRVLKKLFGFINKKNLAYFVVLLWWFSFLLFFWFVGSFIPGIYNLIFGEMILLSAHFTVSYYFSALFFRLAYVKNNMSKNN